MRAELMEETGYEVSELTHLFDIYMSPGSVTEYLAFSTANMPRTIKWAQAAAPRTREKT